MVLSIELYIFMTFILFVFPLVHQLSFPNSCTLSLACGCPIFLDEIIAFLVCLECGIRFLQIVVPLM